MEAYLADCVARCLALFLYEDARFLAERLVAAAPTEHHKYLLATCHWHCGQPYRAAHLLAGCASPPARYLRARCLYEGRDYAGAEAALLSAGGEAGVPHGAAGLALLGKIAREASRADDAAAWFAKALRLDPMLWSPYEGLCALGEAAQAQRAVERGEAAARRHAELRKLVDAAAAARDGGGGGGDAQQRDQASQPQQPHQQHAGPTPGVSRALSAMCIDTPSQQQQQEQEQEQQQDGGNIGLGASLPPSAAGSLDGGVAPFGGFFASGGNGSAGACIDEAHAEALPFAVDGAPAAAAAPGSAAAGAGVTPHALLFATPSPAVGARGPPALPPKGAAHGRSPPGSSVQHPAAGAAAAAAMAGGSGCGGAPSTASSSDRATPAGSIGPPRLRAGARKAGRGAAGRLFATAERGPPPSSMLRRSARLAGGSGGSGGGGSATPRDATGGDGAGWASAGPASPPGGMLLRSGSASIGGSTPFGGGGGDKHPRAAPQRSADDGGVTPHHQQQQQHSQQQQPPVFDGTPRLAAAVAAGAAGALGAALTAAVPTPAPTDDALAGVSAALGPLRAALAALAMHEPRSALGALRALPPAQAASAEALILAGKAHSEAAEYAEAAAAFAAARRADPHRAAGLEAYSTALWHLRRAPEAAHLAAEAVAVDRAAPAAWCAAGNALSLAGDARAAAACFRRALQLDPANRAGVGAAAAAMAGHEYLSAGDAAAALAAYRGALRLDGRHTSALYGIGQVLLREDKPAEALAHFQAAARANPSSSVLACCCGVAAHRMGQHRQALRHLSDAVRLDGRNPLARYQRAAVLVDAAAAAEAAAAAAGHAAPSRAAQARYREALAELGALQAIAPREPAVLLTLGRVHKRLGDLDAALAALNAALDLAPTSADVAAVKAAIDRLHRPDDAEDEAM